MAERSARPTESTQATSGPTEDAPVNPADIFYCRARRRRLVLEKCLEDYVESNAFNRRKSACWRCPQGRRNRERYAAS